MIRRDDGDRWLMIAQPEHARLSGELAALWREGGALPPSVVYAVTHHDDGWIAWEAAPKADPATGRPVDVFESAPGDYLEIWQRGPSLVARADAYAGILVSHHSGWVTEMKLHGARSLAAGTRTALERHIDEQRAFRAQVARAAGLAVDPAVEARHVTILRLLDSISLDLCRAPAQTDRLEVDGLRVDLAALGERAVALSPWPFGAERREIVRTVEAAPLPKARYTDASLAGALAATRRERLEYRFVPGL
jgi:hypothetical protein